MPLVDIILDLRAIIHNVIFLLFTDNLLYGRARSWHWFIWSCLPGTWDYLLCSLYRFCRFFFHRNRFDVNFFAFSLYFILQAKCLETGDAVAIKKVLQDKRYKNRELQIMRLLDHPNVVQLKHCFFSTTEKDELYLNLVLEYISETVYRVSKHYVRMNQHIPMIYVQLYTYQVILHTICGFFLPHK